MNRILIKKYLVECKLFNEIIDRKKLTMKDNVIIHAQRKIMLELTLVLASMSAFYIRRKITMKSILILTLLLFDYLKAGEIDGRESL